MLKKVRAEEAITQHSYWTFSLELYGKAGVLERCLDLQNQLACNVNIFLFMCLCAHHCRNVSMQDIGVLYGAIEKCERILKQHRLKRAAAKGSGVTYDTLKQEELVLEQQQQKLIVEFWSKNLKDATGDGDPVESFCSYHRISDEHKRLLIQPVIEQLETMSM